jgi:excisionase family DNA binding protein
MDERFLTVDEIAGLLKFQVEPQTIRNRIDRGELAAIRVGSRRVRVKQSDLDAFLTVSETTSAGPGSDETQLRHEFATGLDNSCRALDTDDDAQFASSLRTLAVGAMRLAQAIDRPRFGPGSTARQNTL